MMNMENRFEQLNLIYQFGKSLSFKDLQVLMDAAKKASFEPHENIIFEGSEKKDVYFIQNGLVRIYLINEKGEEITWGLRLENEVFNNIDKILFDLPSKFFFEALEPTDVFYMDHELLQDLIDKNPKLEKIRKFMLLNLTRQSFKRIDSLILLSPEERYIEFVKSNPDIVNRVPNKYIANIIGITPVSLSRIRQRIASNKR